MFIQARSRHCLIILYLIPTSQGLFREYQTLSLYFLAPEQVCRLMDHGYQTWNQLHLKNSDHIQIPLDVLKARSWGLIHHAMFHTYPHHDAEGYATWVEVDSGVKFWVILRPKEGTVHADRRSLYRDQTSFRGDYDYSEKWEAWIITAWPGDIM
jgi:hypothetical protein